jgi:hypothetical protein
MHGPAQAVERKIRLWIVRQEHDRRKEGQLGRINAHGDAPSGASLAAVAGTSTESSLDRR